MTGSVNDREMGNEYSRKATVLSLVYLVLIAVVVGWQISHYGTPDNWIEGPHLNSLGDFLAGVFAPIAFVWVAVAVFIQSRELAAQREELALSREELKANREVMKEQAASMDEQHKLSLAAAKANYKFALFDKRVAIYNEFNELAMVVNTRGTMDQHEYSRFIKAGYAAKNIFGDDEQVRDWVNRINRLGGEVRKLQGRIDYFNELQNSGTFGQVEQDKRDALQERLVECQQNLGEAYDWDEMDHIFLPYLNLPSDIVVE